MESVHLKHGRVYRGLIRAESEKQVEFVEVFRRPGKPMFLVIRPIAAREIVRFDRLPQQQRAKLIERIERFRNRFRIEAERMDAVELSDVTVGNTNYRYYVGKWFTLLSTAEEETTRRSVVRIEQIFRAYCQVLPPRIRRRGTLRIVLLGSMDEYHDYLHRHNLAVDNPAFFLTEQNVIVAGSELTRFARHLAASRARHERIREKYEELNDDLPDRKIRLASQLKLRGYSPQEIEREIVAQQAAWEQQYAAALQEIKTADRLNEAAFADVTRQMFVRVYHEAFHAYLENYVYPRDRREVPIWLNEGLAQIFESGQLDADALRIDAPNRPLLKRLQRHLDSEDPLSLSELIAAERDKFLVAHDGGNGESEKFYCYCWGLAYYLTFHFPDPILGTAALDRYVAEDARRSSPTKSFQALVGMPLPKFERRFTRAMRDLKPPPP